MHNNQKKIDSGLFRFPSHTPNETHLSHEYYLSFKKQHEYISFSHWLISLTCKYGSRTMINQYVVERELECYFLRQNWWVWI